MSNDRNNDRQLPYFNKNARVSLVDLAIQMGIVPEELRGVYESGGHVKIAIFHGDLRAIAIDKVMAKWRFTHLENKKGYAPSKPEKAAILAIVADITDLPKMLGLELDDDGNIVVDGNETDEWYKMVGLGAKQWMLFLAEESVNFGSVEFNAEIEWPFRKAPRQLLWENVRTLFEAGDDEEGGWVGGRPDMCKALVKTIESALWLRNGPEAKSQFLKELKDAHQAHKQGRGQQQRRRTGTRG